MALKSEHTTPNYAKGDYFSIVRFEGFCSPGEPVPRYEIWVGFYASEEARRAGADPLHQYRVAVPFANLDIDPRTALYDYLKQSDLFDGAPVVDALDNDGIELDVLKKLKKAEIERAKAHANRDHFMFRGHKISADPVAMLDIQTTMQGVLSRTPHALRADWPGGWVAMDDTPVAIPDVATWFEFHSAMETQGLANLDRARKLTALVDAATAAQEVDAIHWHMEITPAQTAIIEGETSEGDAA